MHEYSYPYIPEGRQYLRVPATDPIMRLAIRYARDFSKDPVMPTGAVIAKDRNPIACGANGSDFHRINGCARQIAGSKTGEDYHLCEGCQPINHSESRALCAAQQISYDFANSDLYLWGHFGCCHSCWKIIEEAGIKNIYLLPDAEMLFNKNHPQNVVGSQLDYFRSYL
jgi:deoxycytidylate deaminase